MSRNRVDARAHLIYEFLKDNLNTPYDIGSLVKATGLKDSSTTRAAIKRARDIAEADGLCLPVACPANGQTYCVTDDPRAVIDPAIHLGSIAVGVGVRKDVHDDFIASRMGHLTASERKLINTIAALDESERKRRQDFHNVLAAVVAVRREGREAAS